MHFDTKSYLKSNRNHIAKQTLRFIYIKYSTYYFNFTHSPFDWFLFILNSSFDFFQLHLFPFGFIYLFILNIVFIILIAVFLSFFLYLFIFLIFSPNILFRLIFYRIWILILLITLLLSFS